MLARLSLFAAARMASAGEIALVKNCHSRSWASTLDNGAEFINGHLLRYCRDNDLKFTRWRSGNRNDGAHVEQRNWTTVRQLVDYVRYDAEAELLLLNKIWEQQALIGNHFSPQQKPMSKPATVRGRQEIRHCHHPLRSSDRPPGVKAMPKRRLTKLHGSFNPAAVHFS